MVKRFVCLLSCWNLLFAGCDAPERKTEAGGRGSVWVVEAAKGGRLYLCGTIHLLRESDYPLAEGYEAAYAASEELILELPPGASASSALSQRMRELGTLGAGERLEDLIDAEDWGRVKAWAQKRGMAVATLDTFRPWFVSLVMVAVEYEALGASANHGVDQHFEERAVKDGKSGLGLETVEQQLQLFVGMTGEQEREVLKQTLAELETAEEEFENMIRAWKEGDIEGLQGLLFREVERYPEIMEVFLHARNRAWVPRLEEHLEKGRRAMVLVGAGHLGGPQGLIALLKAKGYRVRHWAD